MGDRANIVIVDSDEKEGNRAVFLYGHWSGRDLPSLLKDGLAKGESRWTDASYLARILFQTMLQGDDGTTGFGISTTLTDNEYPLLVVDIERQVVVEYPEDMYRVHGFTRLNTRSGVPFKDYNGKWRRQ